MSLRTLKEHQVPIEECNPMNEPKMRTSIIDGLILVSILKILTILVGITWLELHWIVNPPRPGVTFFFIILWTLIEIPLALWLWFPHRGAWIAILVYDLLHLMQFVPILLMVPPNGLTQFMMFTLILVAVRLMILPMRKTRDYYGILSS